MKDLLITIFTHNRPEYLALNMASLRTQTFKSWDLLVVDDYSDTRVSENPLINSLYNRITDDGHNVRFYRNDSNLGIAKSRKKLIEDSMMIKDYAFVFDLNDDHFLEPNCIELMMQTMKSNDKIGCVGSCSPMFWWTKEQRFRKFADWKDRINNITFDKNSAPYLHRGVDWCYVDDSGKLLTTPIKVEHCSQFIWRTGVELGKLPEEYSVVGFTEETDFSLRFRRAGYVLLFQPNAINWHLCSPKGGIREKLPVERQDLAKDDWGVFLNNWSDWLQEEFK
jgi:GT2 family glycosyltransferase